VKVKTWIFFGALLRYLHINSTLEGIYLSVMGAEVICVSPLPPSGVCIREEGPYGLSEKDYMGCVGLYSCPSNGNGLKEIKYVVQHFIVLPRPLLRQRTYRLGKVQET